MITSWLGPNKGYGKVPGETGMPYQALNVVTPGFPEYVSGHSTFSAAGRAVINQFFGTDNFNAKVTIPAGSSKIEPGVTPAKPVVLSWKTLDAMADQAGMSRRYGGIHFESGDQQGRALGALTGLNVWTEAQTYFAGTAADPLRSRPPGSRAGDPGGRALRPPGRPRRPAARSRPCGTRPGPGAGRGAARRRRRPAA